MYTEVTASLGKACPVGPYHHDPVSRSYPLLRVLANIRKVSVKYSRYISLSLDRQALPSLSSPRILIGFRVEEAIYYGVSIGVLGSIGGCFLLSESKDCRSNRLSV